MLFFFAKTPHSRDSTFRSVGGHRGLHKEQNMPSQPQTKHEKSPPPELEGKGSHKAAKEFEQVNKGLKLPLLVRENKRVPKIK